MGRPIGELLVESKALSREKLEEALKLPREAGKKLGQVLIERGFVTEAQLTQSLSFQLSVPWVSLYHIDFSRQLLSRVPREIAERNCLVPIYVRHVKGSGDTLYVAIEDPTNDEALAETSKAAGLPVRPMIASASDIRSAIRVYYGTTQEIEALETVDDVPTPVNVPMPPLNVPPPPASAPAATGPERKPEPPPLPPKRKPNAEHGGGAAALAQVALPPPPPSGPALTPTAALASTPAFPPAPPSRPPPPSPVLPPPSSPSAIDGAHVDSPDAAPEVEAREITMPGKRGPRMVALTLLDGTSLQLPARPRRRSEPAPPSQGGLSDQLTSRDLIAALRAHSHGADVSEIIGDDVHWEAMFAALLSLLLKKGMIADWEFIEELRKV